MKNKQNPYPRITAETLHKLGACAEYRKILRHDYPRGIIATPDNVRLVTIGSFNAWWIVCQIGTPRLQRGLQDRCVNAVRRLPHQPPSKQEQDMAESQLIADYIRDHLDV